MQVANDSNIFIPIHFTTSSIHLSSVQIFKFPIRPPEPNHVQDKRFTLHIFQDMLGILNDTPKLNFKFYLDLLLKRDSGVPEINTDGVELSSELICKAVKDYEPKLIKMKEEYFKTISENVIIQHVKLSLLAPLLCCKDHFFFSVQMSSVPLPLFITSLFSPIQEPQNHASR